jgi:hypothetical protein
MKSKIKKIDAVIIVIMIIIAGLVFYKVAYEPKKEKQDIPVIQFFQDEENNILIVRSVSKKVLWMDIEISGDCDKSSLGKYIKEGDKITDCIGTITIKHKSSETILSTYKFAFAPKPPSSFITGNLRDVSPHDEGVHFNKIANIREWWYFTVVFDKDSDLAGWTATIGFCHMSWGDLRLTFKPDILVVTLHSPDGKEYGGLVNKQRKEILGILGSSTLEAHTPGVDLKYGKSWAKGEAPEWHVHAEDGDIDKENEIIIDLDFFSPSSPIWIQSNRLIDQGSGDIANYIFTGCEVVGEVILDGLKYEVKGIGHHEHCWSLGVVKFSVKGWDWCHMTLDNGWNIYYSKYYLKRQIRSKDESKINPYASLIITTNQGETITKLDDLDISMTDSDKLFLLLKMPSELDISAKASSTQILLKNYNIELDINLKSENTYEKTWKFPTYVGMKIGLNNVTGNIKWNDEDGDHEIELNGTGTIWNMRKF